MRCPKRPPMAIEGSDGRATMRGRGVVATSLAQISVRPSRAAGGCQFAAEVDAPGDDLRAPWSGCLSAAVTGLCARVAEDLTRKGYLGRTIGVKLRFDDIRIVTRDLTVPAPTADVTAIRRAATVP